MPLSAPAPRRHRHTRRIELNGYEREDGLWDIEAHLTDTKGYAFHSRFRGDLQPGDLLHEMWLRLTVDDSLTVRAVEAVTDNSPFPDCPAAAASYQQLVGMRIASGWTDQVKARIGATAGCTHLFELLRPLATAAIQTVFPLRSKGDGEARRPMLLDTCHGWRAEGEAVRLLHPKWHRQESD
jgi:hypothetical protein